MVRIVQKYGGTSLKDIECIGKVAENIKNSVAEGDEVIVVVSARAGVTDKLIANAKKLSLLPNSRELDVLLCSGEQETAALLAIALDGIGVGVVSQLAFQADIRTCSCHGNAKIKGIGGGDIEKFLAKKNVVIVAGFQGITEYGDLTTLGRGGSDLTALALAHRFRADRCEIYTDVPGVHTGDPRIVKNAKVIERMDFASLLKLSFFDNKIMQDRSVAFAQKNKISFTISNAFGEVGQTTIDEEQCDYESSIIGITGKTGLCLVLCEFKDDVIFEILEFYKKNNSDVNFIKYSREDSSFHCEISISSADFKSLAPEFSDKFQKYFEKFNVVENLSRVDVIVANTQSDREILHIFDTIPKLSIIRYEYGKHGVSVLVQSDKNEYEALLNGVHDSAFRPRPKT